MIFRLLTPLWGAPTWVPPASGIGTRIVSIFREADVTAAARCRSMRFGLGAKSVTS